MFSIKKNAENTVSLNFINYIILVGLSVFYDIDLRITPY